MKAQILAEILTGAGGSKDGARVTAPDGESITIYVSMGLEPLIVDRVTAVELADEMATLITAKKERYFVAYEDLRAVRFGGQGPGPGYA